MAATPEAPLLTHVPGMAFTGVSAVSHTSEGTMIHIVQHEESGRVMSFAALLKGSREIRPAVPVGQSEDSGSELVSASAAPSASAAAAWLGHGNLSSAAPQAAAVDPVPQLATALVASARLAPAAAAVVAPMAQLAAVPVAAASVTPAVPQTVAVAVPVAAVALPAAPLAITQAAPPRAAPVAPHLRWGQAQRPSWQPHTDIREEQVASGGAQT